MPFRRFEFFVDGGIDVAVGVTGEHDGLLPAGDVGHDAFAQDGRAEDGAVQNAADGAVGALPHLFEVIFAHALHVGGDGRALDGNAQPLGRLGGIDGHSIVRLVAVRKAEVVVLPS